jgi:hypothetical protein
MLGRSRQLNLLIEVICILITLGCFVSWMLYLYLPENISSTTPLLDVNGAELAQHLRDSAADILMPNREVFHHAVPRFQLDVDFRSRKHPFVKPVAAHERATSAMSAKFR